MRAQRIGKPLASVRANKQRRPVAARKSALKFIFVNKQTIKNRIFSSETVILKFERLKSRRKILIIKIEVCLKNYSTQFFKTS